MVATASETKPNLCRRCGVPLAGDELAGNCPRCLSALILSPEIPEPAESSPIPVLRRLGDYELLEEVARGGMGVVFRARQVSLGREVAVKVLRDAWLATPIQVKRFRAEAVNAAKLKHPNIVAVHEVGEQGGQHFFAMDLVEGKNLAELTREGPLALRQAAELVAKVAKAVQHAHEQGVLHRDLKPSNVLLDAKGEPQVTDFGLARPLDDESSLTLTGQVLGTPGYMSPEQAKGGGAVGPAADVYGLGAVLFHLLTGRAPFIGASAAETLTQVLQQEPLSPRLLNPAVPVDLAAVCLKCLRKVPRERYGSAGELAQDLKRFLDGQSTHARLAGAVERTVRWCRRKPALAVALAALLVVGVLGVVGILMQWRRADFNARAEAQQRQRAEANFQNAREVIDRMFIQVANELEGLPRTEQVRRKLLEDALQYYRGFVKEKGEDLSVKAGAAVAYLRMGTIYARLGRLGESMEPLGRGIALLEELDTRRLLTVPDRVELAQAHATISSAQRWFSLNNEPVVTHRQKQLALCEALRDEFPMVTDYLRAVATAHVDLGNALREGNQLGMAFEHFQSALKLCENPALREAAGFQGLLAHVRNWWGALLEQTGRRDEAEREYRAVIELREQLLTKHPNDAWLKHELAHIIIYLAELLMERGRLEEAEELLRAEVSLHAQLLQDFPGTSEYRRHASWGLQALAQVLAARGRWEEAEVAMRRSLEGREKLVADFPNVPTHLDALADHCYKLGLLLAATGRSDRANEAFRRSVGLWEQLVTPSPKTRSCERGFARMLATCPAAEFRNPQRAVILARQSMLHEAVKAEHWSVLGIAQYRAEDPTAAIESLHKSMELDNGGDAIQWLFLAMCYWQQADPQKAREWYEKAAGWLDKVHPADEAYGRFRAEAAGLLGFKTTHPVRDDNTLRKESP